MTWHKMGLARCPFTFDHALRAFLEIYTQARLDFPTFTVWFGYKHMVLLGKGKFIYVTALQIKGKGY